MDIKVTVMMEVMWGARTRTRAPRHYFINPRNLSGKRLIRMLGHDDFFVTNACPEYVTSANERGTPDKKWMRENLKWSNPSVLLLCGKVAQANFEPDMVRPHCKVIRMPHPAARTWTKAGLEKAKKMLAKPHNCTLTTNGE